MLDLLFVFSPLFLYLYISLILSYVLIYVNLSIKFKFYAFFDKFICNLL